MAPKINCNPLKLTAVVTYLQKSRVAHNIKDLEKHLPSVSSINGMQVKDYLQALQDENKINVEKIGSGNWYWSFASQDKKLREKALADAQTTHFKATEIIEDLQSKLAAIRTQREDEEEDMLDDGGAGDRREDLEDAKTKLTADIKELNKYLAAYSDDDPTVMERKKAEVKGLRAEAEQYTDEIEAMEGWLKAAGQDAEAMGRLKEEMYGEEFDAEEGGLRELL